MKRILLMLVAALLALSLLACDPQGGNDPAQTSGDAVSGELGSPPPESGESTGAETDGETKLDIETTEGGGIELPDMPL